MRWLFFCCLILVTVDGTPLGKKRNANSPPDPPIWTPTTPRTTTSTSSSVSEECPRNASTAWIDVIFLLESSLAAEQDSLLHMWAFAGTLLDNFNVQCANYTDSNYTTRVGVITYGDQAVVNYPLGSVDNAFLDTVLSLPYLAGKVSNLQAGIEAAIDQFAGPNSRPNARKVIVIMAVSYTPGGQYAPQQAANTFKKYGIIVVYNYLPSNLDPTPQLQELATPGYFYTSKNGTLDEMANALSNCFCPKDWIVYMEGTYRQLPTEGCYQLYETTNSYRYVVLECVSAYNSIPAIADSEDKNAFLANMDYGSSFYIGLSWDKANKRWVWADGSELGSYQPWSNSSVIDGSGGFTNVYVSPSANWVSTNPAAAYYTICQSAPCNSMNYCPVIL